LCEALKTLGYSAVKYPRTIECIGADFDAAVDITVVAWMEELDRRWPGAKWVLTIRDESAWVDSCREYFSRPVEKLHSPEAISFMRAVRQDVYGVADFDEERWIESYRHHSARIRTMLAHRPGDLLAFDVTQKDAWGILCSFLGLPVPSIPFPHLNRRRWQAVQMRQSVS
jgi:hypothetical protein